MGTTTGADAPRPNHAPPPTRPFRRQDPEPSPAGAETSSPAGVIRIGSLRPEGDSGEGDEMEVRTPAVLGVVELLKQKLTRDATSLDRDRDGQACEYE